MASIKSNRPQLIFVLLLSAILTHAIAQIRLTSAAGSPSTETTASSSSQPLWSYQVKPNSYANAAGIGPSSHYTAATSPPSIFDAFSGLSQRQGALTSSPFLSILPIILIAAGGMLLLLPFLTMMMASPFSGAFGGGGGGYNNAFGFPQVAAMGKKRSMADQSFGQRAGLVDLLEHVSSTIEELARKYQQPITSGNNARRSKAMGTAQSVDETHQHASPANHKQTASVPTATTSTGTEDSNQAGSQLNNLSAAL